MPLMPVTINVFSCWFREYLMAHVVQNGDHTHKGVSPNTEDHRLRVQDIQVIRTGELPGALLIVEQEVG